MSEKLQMALTVPAELNPDGVTIRLEGTSDEPLMCLADLCEVLGYKDVSNATREWVDRLKEAELIFVADHHKNQGRGRATTYDKWYAKEKEVYKVILGSGMLRADAFSDWVCGEVLPSIRRFGCYPRPTEGRAEPSLRLLVQEILTEEFSLVRREMHQVIKLSAPVLDLVNPREFVLRCWPEVSGRTLGYIVRRMDALYRRHLKRPAPQEIDDDNSRLMCEREQLQFLVESIAVYWRKEHPAAEPELDFASIA